MKYGKFVYGAVAAAVLALAGTAQASNLVVNGSFEDTVVAPGTFGIFTSVNGWTIDALNGNGLELRNNKVGTAYNDGPNAHNFAELDANHNMSIWQKLATVVNQAYRLSFAYSPRAGVGSPADTNNIDVSLNATAIPGSPFGGSGAGYSDNNWMVYTYDFVATSTSTILRFTAGGANESLGGSLDAVSVSAVPLPGAALLFGSALLGAGALRKRKAANETDADALAA